MVSLTLSNKEALFFLSSFVFSFYVLPASFIPLWAILFFSFVAKRTEIYFLWSIIAPRITGDAPILEYLLAIAREQGPGNKELQDLLEINIPFIPRLFVVFKDTYVKRILTTEPEGFPTAGYSGAMVPIANGPDNILLCPGPPSVHWVKYREVTSPINRDKSGPNSLLAEMLDTAWKSMQELTPAHFANKCGTDLLLFKELFEIMIPAHNRALFGEEFARKFQYKEMSAEIYDIISETGKQLKVNFCPPWLKRAHDAKIKRVSEAVNYMMKDSTSAFMRSLLAAKREGKFTQEELLSNVLIFEYAQAPLHVVFWALYLLAMHAEEEKRAVAEIAEVLSRGPISYERLPEFKYISRIVMETLRLYPGVGLLQVRNARQNTIFGEHFVPEGSIIFLCAYLNHRNATYWDRPDEFDPSREGIDAAHYGENLAYIPFGNGPRQCQGQYFALDFVKLSIVTILQHYKVTLAPSQNKPIPTEIGFLRPVYPISARFEKRVLPVTLPIPMPGPSAKNNAPVVLAEKSILPVSPVSPVSSVPLSAPRKDSLLKPNKPVPPKLSKHLGSKKVGTLIQQSQIFSGSFTALLKSKNQDLLVLYGTQTGTSRRFAVRLVQMARLCNLGATMQTLSKMEVGLIPHYKTVVIVTSTYGDGGPPENAERFNYWLETEKSTDALNGVPFAVLALGSSMYPFPFKFGTFVSKQLEKMGAKRILPDHRIDEIKFNQEQEFTIWSAQLFEILGKKTESSREAIAHNKLLGFHDFDFNLLHAPFKLTFLDTTLQMEPCSHYRSDVVLATVTSNVLVNSDPSNLIYSLEASFADGSIAFQAGDNIAVLPSNPADAVTKIIERIGHKPTKVFQIEAEDMNVVDLACSLGQNKCTLEISLTYYFDITSPPSAGLLKFFGMHSNDPDDQKLLVSYASNYPAFLRLQYSVLDVLEMMPSVKLTRGDERKSSDVLSVFLGLLGPIKQRHYSVANFPEASPNTLRLVYKVVDYVAKDRRPRKGLCTNYLKDRTANDKIAVFAARTKYRLPTDSRTPIVLVSTGSGISPYLGFLEQRLSQKTKGEEVGPSMLIHGCRSELDFAFRNKFDDALAAGVLSSLLPAYSRKADAPSVHVGDIVEREGSKIWSLMNDEGAVLFLCGDVSVGHGVREALVQVAKQHGKMSIFSAHAWVRKMSESRRIRTDEWGTLTIDGEKSIRTARLRLWRRSILAVFAFHSKR